jgi:hypothetical protein
LDAEVDLLFGFDGALDVRRAPPNKLFVRALVKSSRLFGDEDIRTGVASSCPVGELLGPTDEPRRGVPETVNGFSGERGGGSEVSLLC